jgi:hypothetical protein
MTDAEKRTRDIEAAAQVQIDEKQNQKGTYEDPIRYEHIKADDPDRKAKRAAQRDQFTADAKAGRVLCLSDLMISHGM